MRTIQITINVPEEILVNLGIEKGEFEVETRLGLATQLFLKRGISLGKAAQVAEITRLDFADYLHRNRIDTFGYEDGELAEEMKSISNYCTGGGPIRG